MSETDPSITPAVAKANREREKAERFRRVAQRRTNAALKQIELLINTANSGNYTFEEDQTAIVVDALRAGVDRLEAAYTGSSKTAPKVEL